MKKSTLLRLFFSLSAAAAIACAPNPAFAQRGGHGGGGGGSHGGGGGGGSFHGGGGGGGSFHGGGGAFGGGGHFSGGGFARAPRSGGSYYGHPGGYAGNHTFYNAGHSYGANGMNARRPGMAPPSNVRFGGSSSFHSFAGRSGASNGFRAPENGWHSFGPAGNSSAMRGSANRFDGNPRAPSLSANRPIDPGSRSSNTRNWAGQGHSVWAASPRSGTFSGSAVSKNHALSSIQSSHSRSLFASNNRFDSSAALHNGMRLGGPLQVHPQAGFRDGFNAIHSSPHPFNEFGNRGFGDRGFGDHDWGRFGNRDWGRFGGRGWGRFGDNDFDDFGRGWGGWGCFDCGFGWGLGWNWGWGGGIGFGWGGFWGPGWGGFWGPGWGGYWGYPYGPAYYDPWYWNGGFYPYPTLDYNLMDSNVPGYSSDDSGNYDNSSNSPDYNQNAPANQNSGYGNLNSPPPSSEGSPDNNAPTNNVAASAPTVLLYMHDGTTITASDYWIEDNEIHYTVDYGTAGTISLNDFDLQRTVDENAKRGVTFTLRPKPDTSSSAPDLTPNSAPDTAPSTSTAPPQT